MGKVDVAGLAVDPLTEPQLVTEILNRLKTGVGGWLLTANLDILRLYHQDRVAQSVYRLPDLVVADGMPLLWAARLSGQHIPERVAGSSLSVILARCCAEQGIPLRLLGGAEGSAEAACVRLTQTHAGLDAQGDSSLRFSGEPTTEQIAAALPLVSGPKAALVLVGLGSPKQEAVIAQLRSAQPQNFYIGVGGTFSFLAGLVRRAPVLFQRVGLEWLHRLGQEPRRLARRYLVHDLPFMGTLLVSALKQRVDGLEVGRR